MGVTEREAKSPRLRRGRGDAWQFVLGVIMPRWPKGYMSQKVCPKCGGKKDRLAKACLKCTDWKKPLLGVTGKNHPTWKGGFRIDRDGYIRTYAPSHPWTRRGGYIMEHDRVMELLICRRLNPREVVHHKNGDPTDNRLENIELTTASLHSAHHRRLDTHLRKRDSHGHFAGEGVSTCQQSN